MKYLPKISDRQVSLFLAATSLLSVLLVFSPIVLISIFLVVKNGENRYTQMEVSRTENIIQNELAQLDILLHSISSWDDTYQFIRDRNQAYIDNNLEGAIFISGKLNLYLAVDSNHQVVYAKYVNRLTQVETPLPFDPQAFLQTYPALLNDPESVHGLVFLAGHPMLLAARPILNSLEDHPSRGTLIFGRVLTDADLREISNLTQRNVALLSASQASAEIQNLPSASALQDRVFSQALNSRQMGGYQYLKDLNGQPTLVLSVESPRDLYQQGLSTAWIFFVILCILGVSLAFAAYRLTHKLLQTRRASQQYLKRFQTVVNHSRDAILQINRDFRILNINPAARELLDLPDGQTQASFLPSILHFTPKLDLSDLIILSEAGGVSEHECVRRDGFRMDLELSASVITETEPPTYSLVLHNITDRKKATALLNAQNEALQVSEERYMLAANGSKDGLWDWNLMTGEIYYSARWKAMLGFQENELEPVPDEWFRRIHPDDLVQIRTLLSEHLCNRTEHFECEYRITGKDKAYHWMLVRGLAVWDPDGYAHRIAGSQTDITERKKAEEQLRYDALHDGLTGIANRTLLIDHLKQVNDRKRRRPDLLFAVFFLDLDRFKNVNDSLGHQAGDQLLIETALRLKSGLRSSDTVSRLTGAETLARIAGDEFVILLEDFQSVEDIEKISERMIKVLNVPFKLGGQEINLSASLGLVIPDQPYEYVEDIVRDADIAMYQAKQTGGGCVVRFHPMMYQKTLHHMQMENELRCAVEQREFEVYYQPIYFGKENRIAGFEALVRWNHPQRGFLPPSEFIQIAEDTGLIVPIGYFVLEEACQKMHEWSEKYIASPELVVSVNFSARQIMNTDFVDHIRSILSKTGFDPKKLWLEVTESILVQNTDSIYAELQELRSLGIRIEIDDFGTGYSSFSYLQNLPVDGFKIDRSFIKDIPGEGQQIVKTLVELGHSLGLTEVAEGVETENQKEYLKTISCDYLQGYLLSKPISSQAVETLFLQGLAI
jgi:diguanylate cyclase (GGDEF)-like protein/PAS domain S-box-containing protein